MSERKVDPIELEAQALTRIALTFPNLVGAIVFAGLLVAGGLFVLALAVWTR